MTDKTVRLRKFLRDMVVIYGLFLGTLLTFVVGALLVRGESVGIEAFVFLFGTVVVLLGLLAVLVLFPMLVWDWPENASWFFGLGMATAALASYPDGWGENAGRATTVRIGVFAIGAFVVGIGWILSRYRKEAPEPIESEASPIRVPSWLGPRLELAYRQPTGERIWYAITRTAEGATVRWKDEEDLREDLELSRDFGATAAAEGTSRERGEFVRKLEEDWHEDPFSFMAPEFLIDTAAPHRGWTGQVQRIGPEVRTFAVGRRRSETLRHLSVNECGCVDERWGGGHSNAGRCRRCHGVLPRLRRCQACGGSGRCGTCTGDGKLHWDVRVWYDPKTGIILRREEVRDGASIRTLELESIVPNVLALPVA